MVVEQIRPIFEREGIPEYVWRSIMQMESGGNPGAVARNSKELSVGLFQINLKAHPQWRHLNLTDPQVNAEIASKYFLKGAYEKAKLITNDPGEQAEYVWKNGIRPNWKMVTASGRNETLKKIAREIAGGKNTEPGWSEIKNNISNPFSKIKEKIPSATDIKAFGYTYISMIVLILIGLFAFYQVFRPENIMKVVKA